MYKYQNKKGDYLNISFFIFGHALCNWLILNNNKINIINPAAVIIPFNTIIADPNPINLLRLIIKSAVNEYIVNVLWTQQNWNTLDNENISIVGSNEQPAIVLENASGIWNVAQIMYNHMSKNISTGTYFRQSNVSLYCDLFFI